MDQELNGAMRSVSINSNGLAATPHLNGHSKDEPDNVRRVAAEGALSASASDAASAVSKATNASTAAAAARAIPAAASFASTATEAASLSGLAGASDAEKKKMVHELCQQLLLTDEQVQELCYRILHEIRRGLAKDTHPKANVKCFVTYVQDLPNGDERGKFLALDLGGTNFRVLLIHLQENNDFQMESRIYAIPQHIMIGSGTQLFDHIAECLSNFMAEHNTFEKMISGMYMGELVRLVLVKMTHAGILFKGQDSEVLNTRGLFFTKYVSEIEADEPGTFTNCRLVFEELGLTNATDGDCANVRYICECVSKRAAHLVSAGIATLINKMDEPHVTVGVDGSVYRFHPKFHNLMVEKITKLIKPGITFDLMLSEDGSGRGAALVAAVACREDIVNSKK
ncbi:GL15877 [Drosophila persimilis]|uniref:Phosphotransferase n=1 Tax=Drosophila persimilis TaxID=7234 RepID=B4H0W6_DROPE|nr:GL15877 [Drosophila persimilis]